MADNIPVDISKWDERDFHRFVTTYSPLFHVFASGYVSDRSMVDDVLQEAFLRLWNSRAKLRNVESPVSYFFTVIKHTILNGRRSRRVSFVGLDDTAAATRIVDDDIFMRREIEAESSFLIAEAVARLAPQSRRVIELTLQEKKLGEIAEEMGISVNTVKTTKYRALAQLAQNLSKEDIMLLLLALGAPLQ